MNTLNKTVLVDIMKLVNKQAEDEGLWFNAQTAGEAYLQNELRKLHHSIETVYRVGGDDE